MKPAAEIDGTGKYVLAIDHKLRGLNNRQLREAWKYAQTAIGSYRPLPQAKQFHQSARRFRWALGGNRSSKSHCLAVETIWNMTGMHPFRTVKTPSVGWYATTTWEKVGDTLWVKLDPSKNGLLKSLPHKWEVVWHNKQRNIPLELRVFLPSGISQCTFKAFEQGRESFQAADLDWAHFDEQFSEDIFTETITRIGPDRTVNFAAALTPIEPQPWLELRTTVEQPESDDVFFFPLDDNRESRGGFIKDELIDATINAWPPEVRQTRREGKWGSYQGAIFQTFGRLTHVVDEAKENRLFLKEPHRLPYAVHAFGCIDWGGSNPFVFVWAYRVPWLDDDWYIFDEYYWSFAERGPRLLKDHAEEIKSRTQSWSTMLERTWADHDPTDAREMVQHGVPSQPADKSDPRLMGIETMQSLFACRPHLANEDFPNGRPSLHIAARCVNAIREIQGYRWKPASGNVNSPDAPHEPLKKDDHAVDAIRMLIHSENTEGGKPVNIPALPQFARRF